MTLPVASYAQGRVLVQYVVAEYPTDTWTRAKTVPASDTPPWHIVELSKYLLNG